MIKNIFIPERIGTYYLFEKRVLALDIGKLQINATQVRFKGRSIIIEKCIEVPLEVVNGSNYNERVVHALQKVVAQADHYDALHVALSSSIAVFKELTLPFMDRDKIALVIDFEVEPLLPFAINDAVVDFIITKQIPEQQSSDVLVAAVPKQHIATLLDLCAQAGINPSVITLDMFALYRLYQRIPSYAQQTGGVALIDFGAQSTRIAYIDNGQLRLIRTLSKSIFSIVKNVSDAQNIAYAQALESLIRFGLEKNSTHENVRPYTKEFELFWKEIAFTLQSFTSQIDTNNLHHIFILGTGATIKGLDTLIAHISGITCKLFTPQKISDDSQIVIALSSSIPQTCSISLSAALENNDEQVFNLRKKEFSIITDKVLLRNQLITAAGLAVFILLIMIGHTFLQVRKLKKAAHVTEQEAIEYVRSHFKSVPTDTDDITELAQAADREVKKEDQLWFSFSPASRARFLQVLLELTSTIDKEGLGFSIDRLHIAENTITLVAHVKDHDALIALEKELRQSRLFTAISGDLDEPNFTMKIRLAKPR